MCEGGIERERERETKRVCEGERERVCEGTVVRKTD